ncbi:hypothetical protein P4H83_05725 [Paenibacillus favisporus]|uniref:hypothetical protein n=1 Tax=Paenibacillus favisporus TaxID=221028 RepID=UPI002DBECEC3|nr:hypothetical protein [Paenibacillus favisporus]MEC0174364.1 hypothetical protein [Paenibacillus favisporus]
MKKYALISVLSLSIVLSAAIATSVAPASPSNTETSSVEHTINDNIVQTGDEGSDIDDPIITPFAVDPLFSTVLGGTNGTSNFTVNKGYGHIKIYVKNTGSYPISVTVQHRDTGRVYLDTTVAPKAAPLDWRSFNQFPQGVYSGDYVVTYRADGNIMSGEAWGMSATINSEL